VFYALTKTDAAVELLTFTIPVSTQPVEGEVHSLFFGDAATTASPWGYGELALLSLAIDEPSGVLVVAFPADAVTSVLHRGKEGLSGAHGDPGGEQGDTRAYATGEDRDDTDPLGA